MPIHNHTKRYFNTSLDEDMNYNNTVLLVLFPQNFTESVEHPELILLWTYLRDNGTTLVAYKIK
jgi:hypothetical protein